jgi:hypothetical protein
MPSDVNQIEGEDNDVEGMLSSLFERKFTLVGVVNEKGDFGAEDLVHDRIRTYVAVAMEESYVIRVDAHFYRMTSGWLARREIADYTTLLKGVPELAPLAVHPECYERLAEKLERRCLRKARNLDCLTGGWMIIEKGLIAMHRPADFSQVEVDKSRLIIGNVEIGLPDGLAPVRTDTVGPNHLVVDPSLSKGLQKPVTVSILEETTVLAIPPEELPNLLPIDLRREVEKTVLDNPTDKELVRFWVEKERKTQWDIFKARCTKEARAYVRMVHRQEVGLIIGRRAKPPRAVKGVDVGKQRFRHVSKTLVPDSTW